MMQLYSDILHRKKYRLEAKVHKILDGGVYSMYAGLEEMLMDSPKIYSRTELVWSAETINLPKVLSSTDVFDAALNECTGYAAATECLDPIQYKFLHINEFVRYVTTVLKPMFQTIEKNRKKLKSFYENFHSKKMWTQVEEEFLSFQSFVQVYVAEGLIQHFLRGELSNSYPKILKSAFEDSPVPDGQMYEWPYKPAVVWLTQDGTIETSLPVTKFWSSFTTKFFDRKQPGRNEFPLHILQLIQMYEDYATWAKTSNNTPVGKRERVARNLYQNLCFALFQKVLAINKKHSDNDGALREIWDGGQLVLNQHFQIVASKDIYKIMTTQKSVYQVLGLVEIHNFIDFLRTKTMERQQGGFRLAFAGCLDRLMLRYKYPFVLRLPKSSQQYVFAPVTFSTAGDAEVDIYRRIFYAKYGHSVGSRNIRVTQFLRPLLSYLASLDKDKPTPDITLILDIINQLLDSEAVRRTAEYRKLGSEVQRILYPDNQVSFDVPQPPPPTVEDTEDENFLEQDIENYRQQHQPQQQSSTTPPPRRMTRFQTRILLEEAEKQRKLQAFYAQPLDPKSQKQFNATLDEVFSGPSLQGAIGDGGAGLDGPQTVQLVPYSATPRPAPRTSRRYQRIRSDSSSSGDTTARNAPHLDTPRPQPPSKRCRRVISSESESSSEVTLDKNERFPHQMTRRHPAPRKLPLAEVATESAKNGEDLINIQQQIVSTAGYPNFTDDLLDSLSSNYSTISPAFSACSREKVCKP